MYKEIEISLRKHMFLKTPKESFYVQSSIYTISRFIIGHFPVSIVYRIFNNILVGIILVLQDCEKYDCLHIC